jgi:hypothetical protein
LTSRRRYPPTYLLTNATTGIRLNPPTHPPTYLPQEIRLAFTQAQSCEEELGEDLEELVFAEFIEAICRVAVLFTVHSTDASRLDELALLLRCVLLLRAAAAARCCCALLLRVASLHCDAMLLATGPAGPFDFLLPLPILLGRIT